MVKYRLDVIKFNLNLAFPDLSEYKKNKLIASYYKNLADIILETIKLLSISKDELNRRAKIINKEFVDQFFNDGRTIILTTSHLCNWEWALAASALQLKSPVEVVYQQIKNKFFNRLMLKIRSRFGASPVEKQQLFRESMRKRSVVHMVALAADQSPPLHDKNIYITEFMGQETVFYTGMERLAKTFQWPVLFVETRRIRRGFYEIEFYKVQTEMASLEEGGILEKYAQLVEKAIFKQPAFWLWSHNRWKHLRNRS